MGAQLRHLQLRLAGAALAICAAIVPAAGEAPSPSTLIILDVSGSMAGAEGLVRQKPGPPKPGVPPERERTKFEIARDALRASLPKAPPSSRMGLVAFGHRQRGCSDFEVLVPPDAGPADRVLGAIDKIRPIAGRGTTPLVSALREAHKAITTPPPAGPASIVILYDGADRCGQDACQAVTELTKTGPKLPIHVVAIGVDKAEIPRMSCVASLTGGRLIEAGDVSSVEAAVTEAVKLALLDHKAPEPEPEAQAPPPPPPAPSDREGPPRLKLTASLGPNTAPITSPVVWRLVKDGVPDAPQIERTAAEIFEPIEAGKYKIEARYGLVLTRGTVEVAEQGLTSIRVPLNAGTIFVSAKAARTGAALPDAIVTLLRKEEADANAASIEPIWIGRGNAEIVVPAGTYQVRLDDDLVHAEQTVTLAAGGKAVSEFTPGLGQLQLSATATEGGAPVGGASFVIAVDDPDTPLGRREIARSGHPEPSFTLPAGTYYVSARYGHTEVRQRVAVGPGDTVQRAIALGLASVEVSGTLDAGAPPQGAVLVHRVLTTDAEAIEVARSTANPATFTLPAGRYKVETQLGNENVRTTTDIEIQAGKDGKLSQRLAAGRITVRKPAAGGAPGTGAWEVRDSRGLVVWRAGSTPDATTLLAPGSYVARSETANRTFETPFDVKPGEQRTVDLATP